MKKHIKAFIFTSLSCALLLSPGVFAKASVKVPINENNFSASLIDDAQEADKNKDGYLSKSEIAKATDIFVGFGSSFSQTEDPFKGLQYFTEAETFTYWGNTDDEDEMIFTDQPVSHTIDLGGFKKLKRVEIECYNPYLKGVDLSGCTRLEEVYLLSSSEIDTFNLSGCTNLRTMDCSGITARKLDLSGASRLTKVELFGDFKVLNMKGCSSLKSLWTSSDNLTKLKLKGAKKLEDLTVSSDALKSLDLSANTRLKRLDSNCENIISLDLRKNKNIQKIECINNYKLSELKVKGCTKLKNIRCDNAALSKLNIKTNTNLRRLICRGTNITKLDLKNNKKLNFLWCSNTGIQELDLSNTKIKEASGLKCDSDVSVTYAK